MGLVSTGDLQQRDTELDRLSRLYAALSRVNRAIAGTRAREPLLKRVCDVLVEDNTVEVAWIDWHSSKGARLEVVAHADQDHGASGLELFASRGDDDSSLSRTAFKEGHPVICNDLSDEPGSDPLSRALRQRGFRAAASFPIHELGAVVGTLNVCARERLFFRDHETVLLSEAANDLSFALDALTRETERQEAEQKLRRERDFSEALLNSLPGVLYLYDRNRKFLRWNENFERVTGYSANEISELHPLQLFCEEEKALVESRIAEVFESGEASVDAGLVSKDGTVTAYHFTGVRTQIDGEDCLIGVGIDISKRNRAEAARQASEARYRTLFEYAPDGIVIADAESNYIDANQSMCRMLGYTREEFIRLHASDIVDRDEVPEIPSALAVIKSPSNHNREWRFRRKDGSVFAAEVMATLMPDGNLLGMIRDITERKDAERALHHLNATLELKVSERTAELQRALVRAEAADRLKSAFLATMSHELRTPLNSIIGFTAIVLQGLAGPLGDEQKKQLGMVRGSAKHLLALINDVLDLSKIEAGQLEVRAEAFDLRASLQTTAASVAPLAEAKGLELSADVDQCPPDFVSDQTRVEQIVLNLLNNALKFTDRGSVRLTTELTEDYCQEASTPGVQAVTIRVKDTGMGITEADLQTLFQPFRQLDSGLTRQHEGTGLGLAICRRLARLLGGEISVTSVPMQGSEFSVTLPVRKGRS